MKKNLYLVFAGLFFAACLCVCAGVWYSLYVLEEYREELDTLNASNNDFRNIIASLEAQNRALSKITELKINSTHEDAVAFYSEIRQAAENNHINFLSMNSGGIDTLVLRIQGDYYSLAHFLADMRKLNSASRINSLRIRRDETAPGEFVAADLVLGIMTR